MKNILKKIIGIGMIAIMLISMMPLGVFAEGEGLVRIAGQDMSIGVYYGFSDGILFPLDSENPGDSYIFYESDRSVVLKNINIYSSAIGAESDSAFAGIFIAQSGQFTVKLSGNNTVLVNGYYPVTDGEQQTAHSFGINARSAQLSFEGDGFLSLTSADLMAAGTQGQPDNESIAIAADSVILSQNVSVSVNAGDANGGRSYGVYTPGGLKLTSIEASVDADAKTAAFSSWPVSGVEGYEIKVQSDINQGLMGSGLASVSLQQVSLPEQGEADQPEEQQQETISEDVTVPQQEQPEQQYPEQPQEQPVQQFIEQPAEQPQQEQVTEVIVQEPQIFEQPAEQPQIAEQPQEPVFITDPQSVQPQIFEQPVEQPVQQPQAIEPQPVQPQIAEAQPAEQQPVEPQQVDTSVISSEQIEKVPVTEEKTPVLSIGKDVQILTGVFDSADADTEADTALLSANPLPVPTGIEFKATGKNSGYLTGGNICEGMGYKIGNIGGYTEIGSLTDGKFYISVDACTIYVASSANPDSSETPLAITVNKAVMPAPSDNPVTYTNATAENPNKGTITVNEPNKYACREKDSTDGYWMFAESLSYYVDAGKTYEVFIPATGNTLESDSVTVEIRNYNAPQVELAAVDYDTGYLNKVDSSMSYKFGGNWVAIGDGTTSVYFSKLKENSVISVKNNDTGAQTDITLSRQPSPKDTVNITVTNCTKSSNNDGTITLSTSDYSLYEYKKGISGEYKAFSAQKITGLSNGDYYIRTRASGTKLASDIVHAVIAEYIPPSGIACQMISMLPYEKIFDKTDGYSTLTVTLYPYNTTDTTVYFTSSNSGVVNFGSQPTSVTAVNGTASILMYPVGTGEATIYATTSNGKQATCKVTVSFEYRFTYNKSGTWYYDRGGDYTVQTNGPMASFTALKINGNTVNPQYYTTRANTDGTTILTISQYAMSCLNHGAYQRLQLCYADGGVATTFLHIMSVNDKPITGDSSCIGRWVALSAASLMLLGAVIVISKKKK